MPRPQQDEQPELYELTGDSLNLMPVLGVLIDAGGTADVPAIVNETNLPEGRVREALRTLADAGAVRRVNAVGPA